MRRALPVRAAALAFLSLLAPLAGAADIVPGLPAVTVMPAAGGGETWTVSVQVLLAMTLLTLLPAALLTMTGFARILIVLGLLRHALGTGQTPSNQILVGLSLFLTIFVMQPTFQATWDAGVQPYLDGAKPFEAAARDGIAPLRGFMLAQTRDSDLLLFSQLSKQGPYAAPDDVPLPVLAASFLTSELKTAFQIGFYLFIPFVVIDLVVSSVLLSMGMMMLSPMLISLPFKLMLFVLVDGWALVLGMLASSFRIAG